MYRVRRLTLGGWGSWSAYSDMAGGGPIKVTGITANQPSEAGNINIISWDSMVNTESYLLTTDDGIWYETTG